MCTVQEIEASLTNLSTDELRHIERIIRDLYRTRREHIIYDDDYGIWTEQDQNLKKFLLLDKSSRNMGHNMQTHKRISGADVSARASPQRQ